jgi:hypothetical protein
MFISIQAMVAHAYTSYSGGRDQEDHGSKSARTNSSRDPISKKPITKWVGGVAEGVGPEFKPKSTKKKCISIYESMIYSNFKKKKKFLISSE